MLQQARVLDIRWLRTLRWAAVAGQLGTILFVRFAMGIHLPLEALLVVVGLEALTNVVPLPTGSPEKAIAGLMVVDLLALTSLLYLSGGTHNPFNFLYLVHIALAAVVLPAGWTWAIAALSAGLFALLFWKSHPMHDMDMELHTTGMWVAFAVAAVFIAWFVSVVKRQLAVREQALNVARQQAAHHERLAALATLAAGAAHELGSPLSTILVAAGELEDRLGPSPDLAEDARLIKEQVRRCRTVLDQMAADSGQASGEPAREIPVEELVALATARLDRSRVEVDLAAAGAIRLTVPERAVARSLRGVIDNALRAGDRVGVTAALESGSVVLTVTDDGPGMAPDVLERATDPFFTTRAEGEGMGLGLFVARSVLEQVGGELRLRSEPGRGTTAELVLPANGGAA